MPKIMRKSSAVEPDITSDEDWLEQHRGDYPVDTWLAARGHQVLAQETDIDRLMQSLNQKHVDPSDVAIIFNESVSL
ncbi:hypothetical protein [Paraburkholderia tropica]|uniref:hypothetical protein n=1 Tax=Paraburkholderia tropica TaxID=92647 RepID=UPI002AB631BF|nr:hypothetical protein [Paraburkholderia tropica]